MVLNNNLYSIKSREAAPDGAVFVIQLNPECFIYKAHFPEQPITPGVCVTQIAVELAEEILGCKLQMTGVKNVKFLSIMSPADETTITYILKIKTSEEDVLRIQADALSGETVYAKMSLICKKA